MKKYLNYLFHEMLPALFKGIVRFVMETFTVVKLYFWWLAILIAVLYFADIGGTKGWVDGAFRSIKNIGR